MRNILQNKIKNKSGLWVLSVSVFSFICMYLFYVNLKGTRVIESHVENSNYHSVTANQLNQAKTLLKDASKRLEDDSPSALNLAKQALILTDLNVAEHNEVRAKILLLIATYYSTPQNLDKELLSKYGLEGLGISRRDNNVQLQIQFLNELGTGYGMSGDMSPAHNYLDEAFKLANSIGDKSAALMAVNGLAITKIELAKFDEATRLLQQGIALAKELNNTQLELGLNHNLAVLYGKLNQPAKTIDIYKKLLKLQKNPYLLGKSYSNLGNNYILIGETELAITHALKALELYKKSNEHLDDATAYSILGRAYQAQKQYDKAELYFNKALKMANENEQHASVPFLHDSFSILYSEMNQLDKAIEHGEAAVALYRSQSRDVHLLDSLLSLSEIYAKNKDYKNAYKYQVEQKILSDEAFNKDKIKYVDELNKRFETDKKNQEIEFLQDINLIQKEKLKQEEVIRYIVISLCVLIVGVFFLWYRHIHQQKLLKHEKERNNTLEELDKTKDLFFASVTHELRTPVHAMMNLLNNDEPSISESNFKLLNYSCHRLSRIIDDIVDWSLIKSESLKLNVTQVDISSVLNYAIKIASAQYGKPGVIVDNLLSSKPTTIEADENRLFQMFCNLISNALKNTESGYVKISETYDKAHITFSISDSGKGLSQEQLKSAFKPFTSFDSHAKSMGLGLSICQQLAKQHYGDLIINSVPGEGTEVLLTLPLAHPSKLSANDIIHGLVYMPNHNDVHSNEEDQTMLSELTPGTRHLLIVDDDLINCKTLSRLLEELGYRVDYVQSASACLIFLEKYMPDLLLVDIMMPEVDGIALCTKVRERWTTITLPIIMLTARRQCSDLINCMANGANDFMTKPFLKEELSARISSQLSYKAQIKLQSENEHLKWEMRQNQKAEQALKTSKHRMEELLNHSRDYIFAVESDGLIIYANQKAQKLVEYIENTPGNINQWIYIDSQPIGFPLDENLLDREHLVQLAGTSYLMIITEFNQDESLYKIILQVKGAINLNLSQSVINNVVANKNDPVEFDEHSIMENDYRQGLVSLMNFCISHWEKSTGESRMLLAEKSRIWRISIDGGRLRTRTLDRYMSVDSLPKNPKWRNVFRTAYYVLSNCHLDEDKKNAIDVLIRQISSYLDQRQNTDELELTKVD